jgi:hypothetical protein
MAWPSVRSGCAKALTAAILLLAAASFAPPGAAAKSMFPGMPEKPEKNAEATPQTSGPPETLVGDLSSDIDAAEQSFGDIIRDLRKGLREAAVSSHNLGPTLELAVQTSGEDGTSDWLMPAVKIGVIAIVAGWVVALLFRWWARRQFLADFPAHPTDRYQKIAYLLAAGVIAFAATLVFAIVAWAISEYAHGDKDMSHRTVMIMVGTVVFYHLLMIFLYALLSPWAYSLIAQATMAKTSVAAKAMTPAARR